MCNRDGILILNDSIGGRQLREAEALSQRNAPKCLPNFAFDGMTNLEGCVHTNQSRSISLIGFPAGASLAFFIASSNFLARMSSLLYSWFHESRNLSSRLRCCSLKIPAASVRSTFGPALAGASCESTAPNTASTTSFEWQHGHVTFRLSTFCFAIKSILRHSCHDA